METAITRINPGDLFERVIAGLSDEHEIRMLCNLMLMKLIILAPDETVRRLDLIAESFRTILAFKPKDNAVKQELEKAQQASNGVLKATFLLNSAFPAAAGASTNIQGQIWRPYLEWVGKDFRPLLLAMEQEVRTENT